VQRARATSSFLERSGRNPLSKGHQALVEAGQLDLTYVQADEIRVKGRKMIAWTGLAMTVFTRLWVAGVASQTCDRCLADRLLPQVRAGSTSHVCLVDQHRRVERVFRKYSKSLSRKGQKGCGTRSARLEAWTQLCIATGIKRTEKKRVVEVTRTMTLGTVEQASKLLHASSGVTVLNQRVSNGSTGPCLNDWFASLTHAVVAFAPWVEVAPFVRTCR
jgi:hypothetical protein